MGGSGEATVAPSQAKPRALDRYDWIARGFAVATGIMCLLCLGAQGLLFSCPPQRQLPLPAPLWAIDVGAAALLIALGHSAHTKLRGSGTRLGAALSVLPPALASATFATQLVPLNILATMC